MKRIIILAKYLFIMTLGWLGVAMLFRGETGVWKIIGCLTSYLIMIPSGLWWLNYLDKNKVLKGGEE